jgi:hypothetical protein
MPNKLENQTQVQCLLPSPNGNIEALTEHRPLQ